MCQSVILWSLILILEWNVLFLKKIWIGYVKLTFISATDLKMRENCWKIVFESNCYSQFAQKQIIRVDLLWSRQITPKIPTRVSSLVKENLDWAGRRVKRPKSPDKNFEIRVKTRQQSFLSFFLLVYLVDSWAVVTVRVLNLNSRVQFTELCWVKAGFRQNQLKWIKGQLFNKS